MAPPPATPKPHRFLVPKRSQPRTETPKPVFKPGSQQFQVTPRFSLHSTPRAGPSSSSLTPFRHRGTGLDDAIDSSPPPSQESTGLYQVHDDDGDRVGYRPDSVTDEDEVVRESSPLREIESDDEDDDTTMERTTKRRRLSLSSLGSEPVEYPYIPVDECESDVEMRDELPSSIQDIILDKEPSIIEAETSSNHLDAGAFFDAGLPGDPGAKAQTRHHERQIPAVQQPTFHKAPRFKPVERPEGPSHAEPLPDAFSPRRKGTKYVPGGLASELREWLVDIEAGTGVSSLITKRDDEWATRIRVQESRGGSGSARSMTLVTGRLVVTDTDTEHEPDKGQGQGEQTGEVLAANTVKVILAGPGRLSGLGGNNMVEAGVLVGIAPPTWEVVLEGLGRWGVSCDWVVLR
ncbi:hypothetical protein GGS20DRAFT_431832 [Poronia punctata]|nr:hypothetical protein GGS20DRAFT_431832 [Poronia punctata]